mgnify:FL=1
MGLTQAELNDYVNARPEFFRIEDRKKNLSHADEIPGHDNIVIILQYMKEYFGR